MARRSNRQYRRSESVHAFGRMLNRRDSSYLGEEAVVLVHKTVANEIVRHAQCPNPALLQVVRLVVVRAGGLASILLRAYHDVVADHIFHLWRRKASDE